MLKTLSLSLGLAVALAAGTVAKAGGHGHAAPSPQVIASEQVVASPQGYAECLPAKKHCLTLPKFHMPKICLPKIPAKTYTYEWVLKKKRCGGGLMGMLGKCGHGGGGHGGDAGWSEPVYATGQTAPSAQAVASGQGGAWSSGQAGGGAYGTGQIYGAGQLGGGPFGAGQLTPAPAGVMEPAPAAEEGDAAPEAPVVPSSFGRLGSR